MALLSVLTTLLLFSQPHGVLDGVFGTCTQLSNDASHLSGLDVEVGFGLGWLGCETTNVLHQMLNEPTKRIDQLKTWPIPQS